MRWCFIFMHVKKMPNKVIVTNSALPTNAQSFRKTSPWKQRAFFILKNIPNYGYHCFVRPRLGLLVAQEAAQPKLPPLRWLTAIPASAWPASASNAALTFSISIFFNFTLFAPVNVSWFQILDVCFGIDGDKQHCFFRLKVEVNHSHACSFSLTTPNPTYFACTVTSKGQVTIPQPLRQQLGLATGQASLVFKPTDYAIWMSKVQT